MAQRLISHSRRGTEDFRKSYGRTLVLCFQRGVRKEIFPDGYTVVYFMNDDIKQTYPDGKVVYYFASTKTTQTTLPDQNNVYKFDNGQIETHFVDGTKEIQFADGSTKCIFADGEE